MSLKKTFILALLLAAAIGYIIYIELPRGIEEEKAEKLFADLPRSRIEHIAVTRGEDAFTLKNLRPVISSGAAEAAPETVSPENTDSGKDWQLGEIAGASLESGVLTALTSALGELKLGKKLTEEDVEKDLSVYGLEKPELSLDVKGSKVNGQAVSVQLRFGKKNDFIKERYLQVKVGDEPPAMYLVPEALFLAANKPANDFRSKSLISFVDSDVASFEIASAKGLLQATREAAGAATGVVRRSPWLLTQPADSLAAGGLATVGLGAARLSEEGVAELFREMRNARASQFIDGDEAKDLKRFGLGDDSARVQLRSSDTAKPALEARLRYVAEKDSFGRGPGTYLSLSGRQSVVFVDQDLSSKWLKGAGDLREVALFRIPTADAQRVEITRLDGEALGVEKSSAGLWTLVQSETQAGGVADNVFVDELLDTLSRIQAQSFPQDSRDFGLLPPKAKVRVVVKGSEDSQSAATLVIGNRVSSEPTADFFAGVLVGEEAEVAQPFVVKAGDVERILPRREVLAPVPTPDPSSADPSATTVGAVATVAAPEPVAAEVAE